MKNEFTAIFERDGKWYIAYYPEIPGANGQGQTKAAARRSLADAIALILEDRRKEGLRGVPRSAVHEKVVGDRTSAHRNLRSACPQDLSRPVGASDWKVRSGGPNSG